MIFWRVRFDESEDMPVTEFGYQIMDDNLNAIGVYDDKGVRVPANIAYTTTDMPPALPEWSENV